MKEERREERKGRGEKGGRTRKEGIKDGSMSEGHRGQPESVSNRQRTTLAKI